MRNHTTFLTIFSALVFLTCIGCGGEDVSKTTPTATAKPVTSTPSIVDSTPTTPTDKPSIVNNNNQQYVNTVTLAGITLQVTVKGVIAPKAMIDISLLQTAGGSASAIRVWVGDESGVGSLKIKTHSHGASSHAQAQAPATLPANSAVWVEVQTPSGGKESGKIVPKQ